MNRIIPRVFAAAIFAVMNSFAYDDPDEFEAALARASQSKPRLKAAGATLLSATDDDNTYWATGDLNVTGRYGDPLYFTFEIPKSYTHITSATLTLNAYDVDAHSTSYTPERDEVYFNDVHVGTLTGDNGIWHANTFPVPASAIKSGANNLCIKIEVSGWITSVSDVKLVIDGEVDHIVLEASQNYDDRIQLKWGFTTGLAAEKFYVYRSPSGKPGTFTVIGEQLFARPNQYLYFSDKSCTPGVNYYYHIVSSSGIKSEDKIGKRTVTIIDPKLEFTLEGTDHPLDRGALGISEETDILVAGHAFHFKMSMLDCPPDFTIKSIKLIGVPAGGALAQKEHKVFCSIYAYDSDRYKEFAKGRNVLATSSSFEFDAVLNAGKGFHGKYEWKAECEYEANGTVRPKETLVGPKKNVYFEKYGIDNGVPAKTPFWALTYCKTVPNWFTYWKDDGACPGLKNSEVYYRGKHKAGFFLGGEANSNPMPFSSRYVLIDKDAAEGFGKEILNNPYWSKEQNTFFSVGGVAVYGIYNVEDIVAHEWQHHETAKHYKEMTGKGFVDSDKKSQVCAINIGTCGKCESYDREICDSIVDYDEIEGFKVTVNGKSFKIYGLDPSLPDTYSLNIRKNREYGAYGDNELVSMVAGRMGMNNADPEKDWAYPGEQAGGIPHVASRVSQGKRVMSVAQKTSLTASPSESQLSTDLIISINSITAESQRDQNCVTGLVYTIGVSIQSDEIVDFNGYLFDAQSNIVASAISAASVESDSVALFFDARDIFENSNGGPYTLGKVELTVDDNYSTNNVIGVLYDFAVDPIEVNKDELLCNKGHIIDTVINELSETGIVATVSTKINIADGYLVSAELVSTNDELVAFTSVSNLCVVGTNMFRLAFSSDAIYQNGISGICAVKNVKLWQNDELIDADATGAELSAVYDCSDFVPSNACVAVDLDSGRFIEPSMTTDGMLSSLRFVFDVTNSTDATIGYDVTAVLTGTNSGLVASINTPVYVTNGVNQIELSIPASDIAASGEDGPYRFESIELQPQGESTCGTTYRPNVLSGVYGANDFGGAIVEVRDSLRLIETSDYDVLTFEYSYDVFRVGRVIVEIVLTDRNGDLATNVITTNEVSEIGVKTNVISIARCDLSENNAGAPYAVASLSLHPDILGEEPVYVDTTSLTNIFWQVAPPVFSPVTKTVFFSCSQPVVISCATPGAEIRYTLDGSEPTYASTIYNGSLAITNSVTVKAKAFADNMRPSETTVAEYVHAAIVGGNLVQDGSPTAGVPQVLSIPVPGTYKVSFDYSQGGDIELRLAGNGTTNTLAVIAAASAGSTNFLFDVDKAGKYELIIFDFSLGVTQPADVSSLNICIPDTGRNRSRYWIYETENTFGSTGEWVTESGFVNEKMPVNGSSVFTAAQQSFGRNVTIVTTVEFGSFVDRDAYADELKGAKCGITLGRREDGAPSFLVLSSENGQKVWLNVSGAGLPEPIPEMPYTVKFTVDCTNRTYEVALVESGGHETPLMHGTTNCFSFAGNTDAAVCLVEYHGGGNMLSLYGKDDYPEASFMQGDALSLNGSQTPAITEGEAAWLNSMNSYDVVKSKASSMSRQDIEEAYLLNLDITKEVFGLEAFKVSGVEVTEDEVKIHVWLNRTSAIQGSHDGETRDAPINGILKLYGGNTPQTKDLLNATMVTDANFADGDTATIIYPRNGSAKFFRPVIGTRTE